MAINRVDYGNTTLIDLNDTTAEAADVAAGKYFYTNAGVRTAGTSTAPVTDVWQNGTSVLDGTIAKVNVPDIDTLKVIVVSIASFSSLPQTVSNAAITENHVCIKAELGTPSAQTGDWTVTTSAGSLTLSGSIIGSTTVKLYLAVAE